MKPVIVVEAPEGLQLDIPGVRVVEAREYLANPPDKGERGLRVFNLCRTYRYQSVGYYVSLLASARGHRPLPSVTTLQDLRLGSLVRAVSGDLDELIQSSLAGLKSDKFTLSIYFGRNLAKRYDKLANTLFSHFPVPFLRAKFELAGDKWRLERLTPIAQKDIPVSHHEFIQERALRYFSHPRHQKQARYRFDLAILCSEGAIEPPSNPRAIQKFIDAARKHNIRARVISKEELGRIAEFDGLFLRETTSVNDHTYRFARRAQAEGLVVVDDPESIVRCSNKVYLAEVFDRARIPHPPTLVVHRGNRHLVADAMGFPVVLKRPDSSFSRGVVKAHDEKQLTALLDEFFESSEMVVAQKFTPSEYDWRIGVIDGRAVYACKYFMARGHWQIQNNSSHTNGRYGKVETLPIDQAPKDAVSLAVQSANLMGTGIYGVDIKELEGQFVVMEVNDNPSIEAGCEDKVLKDDLYLAIMKMFAQRMERRGA